jgi:hypothetical protein
MYRSHLVNFGNLSPSCVIRIKITEPFCNRYQEEKYSHKAPRYVPICPFFCDDISIYRSTDTALKMLVRLLQVLTAACTKMTVFWDVAPCNLVEVYLRFRGDDGGSKDLWNVGKRLSDYTAQHPKKCCLEVSQSWFIPTQRYFTSLWLYFSERTLSYAQNYDGLLLQALLNKVSHLYVFYLTTLSVAQTVEYQIIGRLMNCKGHRRRSWLNLRYYLGTCLEDLRKTRKTSVRVAGFLSEIWTRVIPNVTFFCVNVHKWMWVCRAHMWREIMRKLIG